jgi:hypothetical protein
VDKPISVLAAWFNLYLHRDSSASGEPGNVIVSLLDGEGNKLADLWSLALRR